MRRLRLSFATLLAFATPALAQQAPREVHASAPKDVAVTIYRDDLALITETREVDLPGGPAKIVFDGVLDRTIPQSAVIRGFEGAEAERNFDFDGLNGRSLLLRSIGDQVTIRRTAPGSGAVVEEPATIQAAGEGIALRFADRWEALGCSGVPEQIIFPRIPDGLRARPALSTTLGDAPAGRREVTLSYLATGLDWKTDYVITLNDDATRADVAAWITLTNGGEEGFANAAVGVIAGDLSRVFSGPARANFERMAYRACWPMDTTTDFPPGYDGIPPPPPPPPPMAAPAPVMMMERAMADDQIVVTGAKLAEREAVGDYQLYRLAERTGVSANQTKQVMFLARGNVEVARLLRHVVDHVDESDDEARPTSILLRTKNTEEKGLGEPLPRGTARVFAPAGDFGVLYSGESPTRDTAVGLDWELTTGESSDVTARTTIVSHTTRDLSGDRTRHTAQVSVELANATAEPRTVELVQAALGESQRMSNASARWAMKDGAPTFTLVVPPNARQAVTYKVTYIND
jgi:hypothetical protein